MHETLCINIKTQLNQLGVRLWSALSSEGVLGPVFLWKYEWRELFENFL